MQNEKDSSQAPLYPQPKYRKVLGREQRIQQQGIVTEKMLVFTVCKEKTIHPTNPPLTKLSPFNSFKKELFHPKHY